MALSDEFFGPGFDTLSFGRLLAKNPDAAIPHLAAAGITPEAFQQMSLASVGPFGIGENDPLVGAIPRMFGRDRNWNKPEPAPFSFPGDFNYETPNAAAPDEAPAPSEPPEEPPADGARTVVNKTDNALPPGMKADKAEAKMKKAPTGLSDMLAGVKMPTAPDIQRVSTPHVPSAGGRTPQGSPIAALLAQIVNGQANPAAMLRLRQALEGGR